MRVLLAGLVLLTTTAAAQQQRPFSHKLHLQLKLACTTCHTSVKLSTKASDDNLPSEKVCLPCHDRVVIHQPAPTKVSKFDHSLHLKLGNIAPVIAAAIDSKAYLSLPGDIRRHLDDKNQCAACHRGMEESESLSHADFPQMADCLVCHKEIDPPYSCEKCHDNVQSLKPANHTANWVDVHSSGKANLDKPSCAVCHGRKFTCLGCH